MNLAIFDVDGTLTDTNRVDEECFVEALSVELSIDEVETDWSTYPHTTDRGIIAHLYERRFGRQPDEEALGQFKRCFVELLEARCRARASEFAEIPGAAEALGRLAGEPDWAVALATGGWRASAVFKLRTAGFDLDGIAAAWSDDDVSREGIVRAAVARARERVGVGAFARVVSIGDGVWDLRTARRMGLPFVGIARAERAERLRAEGATTLLEDYADYDRLLEALATAAVPH